MAGEFQGKVAVITGGSRGIGRGLAVAFAREGAQTVIASSSADNLAAAAKVIAQVGLGAAVGGRRPAQARRLRAAFRQGEGSLRALRHPDQQCRPHPRRQFSRAARRGVLRRLRAQISRRHPAHAAVLADAEGAQGHVVNIVGGAARSPEPEFTIGSSVNAALANASKGLSKLGMRDGINVNVIHPGNTRTERQEELLAQRAQATGKTVEELRAAALARTGIRRVGEVEDVAALALFLCSDVARHIQGTAIAVDGGATVGYY